MERAHGGHGWTHGWTYTHGWTWVDMGGHGWTWVDMGGRGWMWVDVGGCGWRSPLHVIVRSVCLVACACVAPHMLAPLLAFPWWEVTFGWPGGSIPLWAPTLGSVVVSLSHHGPHMIAATPHTL